MTTNKCEAYRVEKEFNTFTDCKTLYVRVKSWGTLILQPNDNEKALARIKKKLEKAIFFYRDVFYSPKMTIIELDIRASGMELGKQSFMNCNITLFVGKKRNVTDEEYDGLIHTIKESLNSNGYFNFHADKIMSQSVE